jgi:site-specific recombinase XerD
MAGSLRHRAAQEAADGGADTRRVQSLLAHKDPHSALKYVRPLKADLAEKARRPRRFLKPFRKPSLKENGGNGLTH